MNIQYSTKWFIRDYPVLQTVSKNLIIHPTIIHFPIVGELTVERPFKGGTFDTFLLFIYGFYQEPVSPGQLAYWIPRLEGEEQTRLLRLLTFYGYISGDMEFVDGCPASFNNTPIHRLDILGQSNPRFLGLKDGVVLLEA